MINEAPFFIVNPMAGNSLAQKKWPSCLAYFNRECVPCQWAFTTHQGHANDLVYHAIQKGHSTIIAVGGDGTAHEVVNGILNQTIVPPNQISFSVLPIGTGNDWVRSYGITSDLNKWVNMLKNNHNSFQDIGKISCRLKGQTKTRYFLNVAGLAYDAFVVKHLLEHNSRMTTFKYLETIIKCLWKYKLTTATVKVDHQSFQQKFYTINIGKGRFSGGGMQLTPHAIPSNHYFAITLVGNLSKLAVIANLPRLYKGTLSSHPQVQTLVGKKVIIRGTDKPLYVEADGEFLGQTPVEISIIPAALKVITPT